jgi:signal transduction histidine kinase
MTLSASEAAEDLALRAAAFDALPSQVAVLDRSGTILATNGCWSRFATANSVGIPPEMVGENYLSVCEAAEDDEDAQAAAAGIRAVIDGDTEEFSFEYPCHGPEHRRWFMMRAIPVTHEGEAFVLAMHTDITDRREAELAVSDRNDSLSLLAGILSHDLRNPLGVALGRAEMLDAEDDHAVAIRSSLERMNAIVEDALVLARDTEVAETMAVDLATVAGDAWDHVETGDARLETPGTATIDADATMFMQALENLLRNAVENAGQDVTVTIAPLEDGRDGFFVADDGPGIPAEIRDTLFDPGVTTNSDSGGTGLGLAIVERIVRGHDWEIAVTESEDGGARFEVTGVTSEH